MISKKDWHRFLVKLERCHKRMSKYRYAIMFVKDMEVFMIDTEKDRILCKMYQRPSELKNPTTYMEFKHPDSFRNDMGFYELKNSVRAEIKIGYDEMNKLFKTSEL